MILKLLPQSCRVRQIQILSHHFKIATRLDFWIGVPSSIGEIKEDGIVFTKVGYVTLSDNGSSNFGARELKTIHLNSKGSHLKIQVQKNFINSHNLFNQVGIISLTLFGEGPKNGEALLERIRDLARQKMGVT